MTLLEEDDVDVGRPFLVRARPRTAPPTLRGDWSADLCPAPVPAAARAAVVARWTGAGRMEHASVAAFARFSLTLLHHGAPAEAAAPRPVTGRPGLEAHGCLSGETRAHIRRVGLETVVAALAAETLGGGPTEARV